MRKQQQEPIAHLWQPMPTRYERLGAPLPFAGCHVVKHPPGWESACRPLTELGEAYGGWTALVEVGADLPEEGYRLTVDTARIRIEAGSPRAAFYACQTLLQAWDQRALPLFRVEDHPAIAWRGIVEGFYGTPWSHQARLRMLDFLGQVKMNLYLYAPKDDPFHRAQWRDPYPEEEATYLQELIERARSNFVEFCFCISPGLSMVYSDLEEFDRLTAKLAFVMEKGVRTFGLLLDDIPAELQHEADKVTYASLALAHADLANRLHEWLKAQRQDAWLMLCPTFYHNLGEVPYIQQLGERTQEDISIMWTGRQVVSRSITAKEARRFRAAIQRKPLLWDNYPVNDYDPTRLLLAPITGRETDLLAELEGVFANPMNQAEASKIALGTIADYLWNPNQYDPERSWQNAILRLVGEEGFEPMLAFCQENQWSRFWTNQPPAFSKAFEEWQTSGETEPLQSELQRLQNLPKQMRLKVKNPSLLEEIEPWLNKMEQVASIGLEVLQRLEENALTPGWLLKAIESLKGQDALISNGSIEQWLKEVERGL